MFVIKGLNSYTPESRLAVEPEYLIDGFEGEILQTLVDHQVVVIAADTGVGKSTRVPMMLVRARYGRLGMIGVTEPRRVAAMSVSEFVSEQIGDELGGLVGYQIRGDRKLSSRTRVKYMTEGILLRELHGNPLLSATDHHPGYSVIVADEVHERGVNQDLILALMRDVLVQRPDLKLVIMSATIDEHKFSEHFGGAPIIKVVGRMHPVEVRWATSDSYDMNRAVASKIEEILYSRESGDILAFMPDEKSIKHVCTAVERCAPSGVHVFPLYGNQAPSDQTEALRFRSGRRVIVATNIAETSLTIDGVVHVVDSGEIKQVQYVSETMSALEVCEHSKAGCDQRKGRAGRTQAGVCHRLYTQRSYEERVAFTKPEILRMSLDGVLLHLRCLDYSFEDILGLKLMDAPLPERWERALEFLKVLGCVDASGAITDDGRLIDRLAVSPMIGRMILSSVHYECVDEVVTVAAGLLARPVFVRPKSKEDEADIAHLRFMDPDSDALTLLRVYRAWVEAKGDEDRPWDWARDHFLSSKALSEIDRNREEILRTLEWQGITVSSSSSHDKIRMAVASGLIVNLCVHASGNEYVCGNEAHVMIYPGSSVDPRKHGDFIQPKLMVCAELWKTTKKWARGCTVIDSAWLPGLLPETVLQASYALERDYSTDEVQVVLSCVYNGMTLEKNPVESFPAVEGLAGIVFSIVDHMAGYSWTPLHPSEVTMKPVLTAVTQALQESLEEWSLPQSVREGVYRLAGLQLIEQLAGCTTVSDVLSCELKLDVERCFYKEQLSALPIAQQKIEALLRQAVEAEEMRNEMREQEAERVAQKAARCAPLRERAERLIAEVRESGDVSFRAQSFIRSAEAVVSTCNRGMAYDWDEKSMAWQELDWLRYRKTHDDAVARTQRIWNAIDAAYPVCPLCGEALEDVGFGSRCVNVTHVGHRGSDRVILLGSVGEGLSEFINNKGQQVACAMVCKRDGAWIFKVRAPERGSAYRGEAFKSAEHRRNGVVLPIGLADVRDEIVEYRAELEKVRVQVAAQEEACKKASVDSHAQYMTLKFLHIGGNAQCRDGSVVYRSKYVEQYPKEGEMWFCMLGETSMEGVSRVCMVMPLVKLAVGVDEADTLCEMMREEFPGLPEELLG